MMNDSTNQPSHAAPGGPLPAGGEMGERTRAFDWSATPVGPQAQWPQSLKTIVRTMLDSRYAMWLGWGPEFTFFYNDAYAGMTLGPKHPWALGRSAKEVWAEIWPDVGPRAESVLRTGLATWDEGLLLFLERSGFPEETYHTFSYSPVPDDVGGVGGMLCVVTEDTERTIGERRLRTLRELAARTSDEAKSVEDACQTAAQILAGNPNDLPFVLLYLLNEGGSRALLAGAAGIEPHQPASPATIELADPAAQWPFQAVAASGQGTVVDITQFANLPAGPWSEPSHQAVVLPLARPGQTQLAGFIVAGISTRRPLDDAYRGFLDLLAGQVANAVANARAYAEERHRAESLAELDRAKTAFFSNISHEFRTPLTLMLGPVEDLLARSHTDLPPAAAGQLEVVNRNGLRLLRLVNTLLDFSRIEAGRVRAVYQPTDLAAYTIDLASNFRSACERAGLRLHVDCPELAEPVFVDREMWEKIVLNLLSNAFKFTFDGAISVSLKCVGNAAELCVQDTGTGIPAEEIPRLFERFHRIENARGRTHEGSGIGLALVHELVKLHRGTIEVTSEVGQGTKITITVPLGVAHLPADQIGDSRAHTGTGTGASPFIEEALRWLPEEIEPAVAAELATYPEALPTPHRSAEQEAFDPRPRVIVADDNADMRQYIARLLGEHFQVEAVPDGEAALAAARERQPDLVLTDVMMPRLNGFGLLNELRADARFQGMPIIMLSARAGEESRVEGMQAGADDYLVKPFSARELLARVSAHLQMARLRRDSERTVRESEERLRVTLASIGDAVITTDSDGHITFLNTVAETLTGWTNAEALGRPLEAVFQIINEDTRLPVESPAVKALREGVIVGLANHTLLIMKDGTERPLDDSAAPVRDANGTVVGCVLVFRDVTERRQQEKRILAQVEAARKLAAIVDSSEDAIISKSLSGIIESWNAAAELIFGYPAAEAIGQHITMLFPSDRLDEEEQIISQIRGGKRLQHFNTVRVRKDGTTIPVSLSISAIKDEDGQIIGVSKIARNISEQKRLEDELRQIAAELSEANHRKDEFLATLAHELRNPLAPLRNGLQVMKLARGDAEAAEHCRTMMERQLGQMVRLIDDLLDVSRISRGKIVLQPERVLLTSIVEQAVETSRPLIDAHKHELQISVPAEEIYVVADVTRLAQVFSNLLNNAAKYTEPGGQIWLRIERQEDRALVSVRDSGLGIPPQVLPKLFQMFMQVDRSLERSQGGLGIGLSIVKRLTEMHGGSVEAISEGHGKGSEFIVRLPSAPAPTEAAPVAENPVSADQPTRRRILVVDDNHDSATSLAMILKLLGNQLRTAHDGLEALEVADAFRPELILLDIGMPRLNGYDAARLIRERPWGQQVKLVALTGWGQDEDRRRSQEAGFDAHLTKPADPAALEKLLAELNAKSSS